ncbi:MAG: YvcK family protein [Clostridiales bacterium]|nr:YvcK family protein [Clostridiales bacterium]
MSTFRARRAVAIGGGTGLPAVLSCLVESGFDTTAVVTVADDGGSSGVLREELGILPPGDFRNCLVALAEPGNVLASAFQYRFAEGSGLAGHALGNLVLAALADMSGSFPEAVEQAGALLGVRGRVLPSTLVDIRLKATDTAGKPIAGQAAIAVSERPIERVCVEPAYPSAYPPALEAIREADVVVVGPGSLFTSILPNFLVDGVAHALRESAATRIYVCNVANQRGETGGMDAADHVNALLSHGLSGAIDMAIVHVAESVPGAEDWCLRYDDFETLCEPVVGTPDVQTRIEELGVRVYAGDVVDPVDRRRHSSAKLCRAIGKVIA